jgi:hypothetical protein
MRPWTLTEPASGLVFTHTEDSGVEERVSRVFNRPLPLVAQDTKDAKGRASLRGGPQREHFASSLGG